MRCNMDQGLYTGVILLELQKAFDTMGAALILLTVAEVTIIDYLKKQIVHAIMIS